MPNLTHTSLVALLVELRKPDSEARKRYEASQHKWDAVLKPLEDAIDESTRLTAADYAITINAR